MIQTRVAQTQPGLACPGRDATARVCRTWSAPPPTVGLSVSSTLTAAPSWPASLGGVWTRAPGCVAAGLTVW